jgi:hypothetical protein
MRQIMETNVGRVALLKALIFPLIRSYIFILNSKYFDFPYFPRFLWLFVAFCPNILLYRSATIGLTGSKLGGGGHPPLGEKKEDPSPFRPKP